MTAPRCSACKAAATVCISDYSNFFLCDRCETILKREFPHVGRQSTDPVVPTTATAATESATNAVAEPSTAAASSETASPRTAAQSPGDATNARESIEAFPILPAFLDRRDVA